MDSLLPIRTDAADVPDISGLSYLPDYIGEQEEAELAAAIDSEEWDTSWERRRQIFGGAYGAAKGPFRPIPAWGVALAQRLFDDGHSGGQLFDHMLVNEYLAGQGIALHTDYKPYDRTVVSISLLAPCVMDFRHVASGRRESLLLEPRSLLILNDEARYEWRHGIARRKNDRWQGAIIPRRRRLSITFRRHVQAAKPR